MSASLDDSLSASTVSVSSTTDDDNSSIHPNPLSSMQDDSTTTQFGTISRRLSKWRPKKRKTVLAVIVATIGAFSLGNVLTFSAVVLTDAIFLDHFGDVGNGSWVATTALLGALLAAPFSGFLIAKIGRRKTMLLSAIPLSIGWAMIAFAPNLSVLYTARFLTGFASGFSTVVVPQYVSEIAEDRIRGTLSVAFILMLCIGILFTYILGAFLNYFVLSVIFGVVPILNFLFLLCMPESPRYLIQAQKPTAARNALKWLRRASTKRYIEPEISKIENSVIAAATGRNNNGRKATFMDLFSLRVLKPVGISCALMFFAQMSGMNGVSLYTKTIFEEAGTGINSSLVSIIIGGTQMITVLVCPFFLVERLGRKSLLLISEAIMCLSLLALGAFFYIKDGNHGTTPEDLAWLPLAALIVITVGYNIGLGPIPWVIASEILPNDVKELASSCISICYWTLSFIAGKTFVDVKDVIGYMGVYFISSAICFVGGIFVLLLVPETKGKSSDEIQKLFVSRKLTDSGISEPEDDKSTTPDGVDNPSFVNQEPTNMA